jgi:hypothetical protein
MYQFLKNATIALVLGACLFFATTHVAQAVMGYGSGEYTNLCGSGTGATGANACNGGCNFATGVCSANSNFVVKYTCSGKTAECLSNEQPFSTTYNVANTPCNTTVQIDVFARNCRANGSWNCNHDSDLKDYLVWYSGTCTSTPSPTLTPTATPTATPIAMCDYAPAPSGCAYVPGPHFNPTTQCGRVLKCQTPIPTPTPTPHQSYCTSLGVVSGNDQTVPAKVTLRAQGTDNLGSLQQYRFLFGDGSQVEQLGNEVTHEYISSGSFLARAEIKDSRGNWRSSAQCETTINVRSASIESHRSDCSDLYVNAWTNDNKAPSDITFSVSGYDNKGSIQAYKIELGTGDTRESPGREQTYRYNAAGSYTVRAYIKNSAGNWVGGDDGCLRTVTIQSATPMTTQPQTGTPTMLLVSAVASGLTGTGFELYRRLHRV